MLGSSAAWAECRDNFAVGGVPLPGLSTLLPFGQGGSVNSLVSVINTVNTSFLTSTSAFVSAPGGPRPDQQGGGVWIRGMAGTVDTNNTGVTTIPSVFNPPSVFAPARARHRLADLQYHDAPGLTRASRSATTSPSSTAAAPAPTGTSA